MSEIITSTVEKDDGHGFLKTEAIRLTEIGGGILFGISDKRVETRPSNRERTDKPDSDNGEYP